MSAAKSTAKYKGLTIAGEAFVARFNRLERKPHAESQTALAGESRPRFEEVGIRRGGDGVCQLGDRLQRIAVVLQAAVPVAGGRGNARADAVLDEVVALVEYRNRLAAEHVEDIAHDVHPRPSTDLDRIGEVQIRLVIRRTGSERATRRQ